MDFNFSNDKASHIHNPSYHHARLHSIGYPTLPVKNDSLSSESSGYSNSPEYPTISGQYYQDTSSENDSSDEEYNMKGSKGNEVYRPDVTDMGAREKSFTSSSEDDGEEYITNKKSSLNVGNFTSCTWQDGEDIDSEVSIVSNVDEYFVNYENTDQHMLNVDEPVVQNVDKYFLDHDNCSPKKRHDLPYLAREQSLLEPEVLPSNNKNLNSRQRSCKRKRAVYYLSSDEENEDQNSKHKKCCKVNNKDLKKENSANTSVKPPKRSIYRINLSPTRSASVKSKNGTNNSVALNSAYKDSDNCCQNSRIKLTIENKSEVILNIDYNKKVLTIITVD